jgi:hypothetical protein
VVRVVSSLRKVVNVPKEVRSVFAARPPPPESLVATVAAPETLVATALDSALHGRGGGGGGGGGGGSGGSGGSPAPAPPPPASRRASSSHAPPTGLAGLVAEGSGAAGATGGPDAVAHTYAESYPYRQRVILLWQRLDGVDVLLFAMYVQEHGADAPPPNTRKVYIAYLDSVRYLRPITARTACYHELLAAYLSNARQRGYESAFIWACAYWEITRGAARANTRASGAPSHPSLTASRPPPPYSPTPRPPF